MRPAELERRLRGGELGLIDRAYLHRALSESATGAVHSRAALKAGWIAALAEQPDSKVETVADLASMSASVVSTLDPSGQAVRFGVHRWIGREADWIVREVVVDDAARAGGGLLDAARRIANDHVLPDAPAIGELRSGAGQFSAGPAALLAGEPSPLARRAADLWHRLWNGRELDLVTALAPDPSAAAELRRFALGWLAALPDAVLLFDEAVAEGDVAALLWRIHGHHHGSLYGLAPTGRRLRLWGSVVLRFDGDRVTGAHMVAAEAAALAAVFRSIAA